MLNDFLEDYLPQETYDKVVDGEISAFGKEVTKILNDIFISLYLPAFRDINEGQYAPTYDDEQEFSWRVNELCDLGVIPEHFYNEIMNIKIGYDER